MCVRPPLTAAPLSQPASAGKGLHIHPAVGTLSVSFADSKERIREEREKTATAWGVGCCGKGGGGGVVGVLLFLTEQWAC